MTKCAWLRKTSTSICSSILLNSAPGQIVRRLIFAAVLALAGCHRASDQGAQETPGADPQLLAEINRIQAIDNHAHPVRPAAAGEAPDRDYDALPVDNLEPQSDPLRLRPTSPELAEARRVIKRGNPANVLDQLGIEIMLANRVTMGPGLPRERFLWVPY